MKHWCMNCDGIVRSATALDVRGYCRPCQDETDGEEPRELEPVADEEDDAAPV